MVCLYFFHISCWLLHYYIKNYCFLLFFIVIDKKQGRKKRKQDEFPEKDVLHDNKVSSATKSLSVAKSQERRRQSQRNWQKKQMVCNVFILISSCYGYISCSFSNELSSWSLWMIVVAQNHRHVILANLILLVLAFVLQPSSPFVNQFLPYPRFPRRGVRLVAQMWIWGKMIVVMVVSVVVVMGL